MKRSTRSGGGRRKAVNASRRSGQYEPVGDVIITDIQLDKPTKPALAPKPKAYVLKDNIKLFSYVGDSKNKEIIDISSSKQKRSKSPSHIDVEDTQTLKHAQAKTTDEKLGLPVYLQTEVAPSGSSDIMNNKPRISRMRHGGFRASGSTSSSGSESRYGITMVVTNEIDIDSNNHTTNKDSSPPRSGSGLQQFVDAPDEDEIGFDPVVRHASIHPNGHGRLTAATSPASLRKDNKKAYENVSDERFKNEVNMNRLSKDSSDETDLIVEENPTYKTFEGPTHPSPATYSLARAVGKGNAMEDLAICDSSGSEDSSDSEAPSRDRIPVYLDLVDDTRNSQGDDNGEYDDDDEEDDDIYEYYWDSDEFSDEEEVYGNADDDSPEVEVGLRLQNKRKKVMEEIVSTENSYVDRLLILLKTSMQVEGANVVKPMYPCKIHNQMFPSIENLFRLHAENILPTLKARLEIWHTKPTIIDIWTKYQPYLTIYKLYANQFAEAVDLILKYKKTSEDFSNLMQNIESRGEFKKLSLEHYLIEPVQRIGRYKLLLQAYCRSLRPEDEEYGKLEEVIEKMDKQIRECQVLLGAKDIIGDFQKVQDKLEDMLSVLNPKAKLLKEGGATEITSRSYGNKKPRYLILFTDFLLVCTKRISGKYSISSQLDASELKVRPADHLVGQGYSPDNIMLLKGRERAVSFLFTDAKTKEDWEEMLLYAITLRVGQRLEKSNSLMRPDRRSVSYKFDVAPTWIPDDSTSSCMICDAKFKKLVRHRHHCRGCGKVICSKCSTQKMALPYMNNDIKRVCDTCFVKGRQKNPELTRNISYIRRQPKVKTPGHAPLPRGVIVHRSGEFDDLETET